MREIRFIHCADLHIDSPFKGLSEIHPELKDLLYQSTFKSFNNIIDLAIKEAVDCVLISGDIYDGADKSLQAQIRFRNGLQRLSDADIPSFVIFGNHDPLDSWSATLEWPEGVKIFGDEVEKVTLDKDGEVIAYVYGISFSKRDVYDNLALKFKIDDIDKPAIGLLHANIGENTGHEPYAPASKEDLISKGIDYWALGHVHNYMIINESNPAIVYPGNSQARNPRETGTKGCCIVTLDPSGNCEVDFIATDVVRYKSDSLDVSGCSSIDDVMNSIKDKCEKIAGEMDGRHSMIRLSLTGRSDLHSELQRGDNLNDLLTEVREHLEGRDPWIWLERLKLNTAGTYDLDVLRKGSDFVADVISIYDELEDENNHDWDEIFHVMEPLFKTWQGQKYLEELSRKELLELAIGARNATLDKLVRET